MNLVDILKMLNCNNASDIQNKGIKLAEKFDDISLFIQPMFPNYNKNIWENCAKILSQRSDQELSSYLIQLLEWLQDLNWPGAFIIIERLKQMNGKLLLNPFLLAIKKASNMPPDEQEWLDNLSILLENNELQKELDEDVYYTLKKRYDDFWN